jgi:hypothetical protein
VGIYGGLIVPSPDGNWTTYTPANSGLFSRYITDLAIDSQTRIWMGSSEGLTVLDMRVSAPQGFIQIFIIIRNISLTALLLQLVIGFFVWKKKRQSRQTDENEKSKIPKPQKEPEDVEVF